MKESQIKEVKVPKYVEHNHILEYSFEGHQTLYSDKGHDGTLYVKVNVTTNPLMRREGLNIISKHFLTLSEALFGCTLHVNTVTG